MSSKGDQNSAYTLMGRCLTALKAIVLKTKGSCMNHIYEFILRNVKKCVKVRSLFGSLTIQVFV